MIGIFHGCLTSALSHSSKPTIQAHWELSEIDKLLGFTVLFLHMQSCVCCKLGRKKTSKIHI